MPLASADWYIINNKNEVVARCRYQPDIKDLKTRNEIAVHSDIDLSLMEVEYRDGKIVRLVKSQKEIDEEVTEKEEKDEMAIIYHRMFREAYKKAKEEGYTFKKMGKHIDGIDRLNEEIEKNKLIEERMKKIAKDQLVAEGKI